MVSENKEIKGIKEYPAKHSFLKPSQCLKSVLHGQPAI